MTTPTFQVGQLITVGLLYRRVPNTKGQWDYSDRRPRKLAFRPDKSDSGETETGISMHHANMVSSSAALDGCAGYALCTIDVAGLLALAAEIGVEVSVKYDPVAGAIGHAHFYVEGMNPQMWKLLGKRDEVCRVVEDPSPAVDGISSGEQRR